MPAREQAQALAAQGDTSWSGGHARLRVFTSTTLKMVPMAAQAAPAADQIGCGQHQGQAASPAMDGVPDPSRASHLPAPLASANPDFFFFFLNLVNHLFGDSDCTFFSDPLNRENADPICADELN